MITFLHKYFFIISLISLFFLAGFEFYIENVPFTHPAVIIIFLGLTSILIIYIIKRILKLKPLKARGSWGKPELKGIIIFTGSGLCFSLIDILSKIIFYDSQIQDSFEIFPGFGLQSLFNSNPFGFELIIEIIFCVWFFIIGALFFRYHINIIDTLLKIFCAMVLFPSFSMTLERILFNGVHDVFYFNSNLGFLCPYCGLKYQSYVWCPADIFLVWGVIFVFLLYGLCFFIKKKHTI